MNVLILGGTTEASDLARALEGEGAFHPILSLAGRTRTPTLPAIPHRRGGFGGVPGLVAWLRAERIDALIDATHPFAAQMHAHAAAAAAATGLPRLVILRPAWFPQDGDRWTEVPCMAAAVDALGRIPRRVFLTVGQQELAPFRAAPWHDYLVRSIEPPDPAILPPNARTVAARGPFTAVQERELLLQERIEVIVTKNSGGAATDAKLEAARSLGLPVVLVARPPPPPPPCVETAAAALAWLRHQAALRGV